MKLNHLNCGKYVLVQIKEMFGCWLGSLYSVVAQSVRLDLHPRGGAAVARAVADGDQAPLGGGGVRVKLGELCRGEARHSTPPCIYAGTCTGAQLL